MEVTPLLLVATRNAHKVAEIRAILGNLFVCRSLGDFPGAPVIAETGDTFVANARLKAEGLAAWLRRQRHHAPASAADPEWVLADDSGLEVDALDGAPGVHSARFATAEPGLGGNTPDAANNAKLLGLLADIPADRRTARFRCVLVLVRVTEPADTLPSVFEGTCEGAIAFAPRGSHGFGYDPLFLPAGFQQSLAELGDETKNRISHRAAALAAFLVHWTRARRATRT